MRLLITILSIFFFFSANAQFKKIESTGKKAEIKINSIQINPSSNERFHDEKISDISSNNKIEKNTKLFLTSRVDTYIRSHSIGDQAEHAIGQLSKHSFELIHTDKDELGINHLKYRQTYKALPVLDAEIIYHSDGDTYTINGDIYDDINLDIEPTLTAEAAILAAYQKIGGKPSAKSIQAKLVEDIELTLSVDATNNKLVYEGFAYNNKYEKWYIIVDAHTGEVKANIAMCKLHGHAHTHRRVFQSPEVSTARDLAGRNVTINSYVSNGTYYLIDASRPMFNAQKSNIPNEAVGGIVTIDAFNTAPQNDDFKYDNVKSSSSSFPGKETAVSAHANAGRAYEYFRQVHGRNSINGTGGSIYSIINISDKDGSSLENAFWNGKAIFYGNGGNAFKPLALAEDVAGHELTHGVISNTANLRYQSESGALNESFADIFGVMIERKNWQIGEQVVNTRYFPSGALRSLSDPNNGASKGDYNAGYQPKHYNDRYRGSNDNGGVHINSGIPNYAFYLIASNDKVGLNKAEKMFYRALTKYLTSTSNFAQCRSAVVQSAKDLNYGNEVVSIIEKAYTDVGITSGESTSVDTNEGSLEVNPGNDFILFTQNDSKNLYIANTNGEIIVDPYQVTLKSVPSITDDGRFVVFVDAQDSNAKLLTVGNSGFSNQQNITNNGGVRNVVISKDGSKIAILSAELNPQILVYNTQTQTSKTFTLKNPTYTDGVFTENVKYADFIEFSHSGEQILYDALNEIKGSDGNTIEYWDIGLIKVFDNQKDAFADDDQIIKLYDVDEGESVGNPSFAKNNRYIITFDYLKEDKYYLVASNILSGKTNVLFQNNDLSYPNYSRDDSVIIFNTKSNDKAVIGQVKVDASKINSSGSPEVLLGYSNTDIKWGRWFANGRRSLPSKVNEELAAKTTIYPNPSSQLVHIETKFEGKKRYQLYSMSGATILAGEMKGTKKTIDIDHLNQGQYLLKISTQDGDFAKVIIKM